MNESFITYLWKYRYLFQDIRTESGDMLTVIHPGDQNTDSGPDFFNAMLRIGTTTWAGNVEIHVHASDWYKHGHHKDSAYAHAILHVVYDADRPVFHANGEPMQTLVIKDRFPEWIYARYQQMMQNHQWIPCMNQLGSPGDTGFGLWAPVLALERLEYKTTALRQLLAGCDNNWEEAFFIHMAGCFGFKINSMPFEMLARSLPFKIVRQHCGNRFQMEALLFGQSGMLDRCFADSYPCALQKEYKYLRSKYDLRPIPDSIWKFLRLRPSNFPTIRISQLAGFLCSSTAGFFNIIVEGTLYPGLTPGIIAASEYWDTHFLFGKPAVRCKKIMGQLCVKLLNINGIALFLFFFGLVKGQPETCEGALSFLERIKGENNVHIDRWKRLGLPAENAMQTQALLHLKQFYCDRKRCLDCRIGNNLLSGGEPGGGQRADQDKHQYA